MHTLYTKSLDVIAESEDSQLFVDCDIAACSSLIRLIDALKFYKHQDSTEKIQTYFNENKSRIMNDYHHLLNDHLNEDNVSKIKSDEEFNQIYEILISEQNDLNCDINECIMYKRNNRQRIGNSEQKDPDCETEEIINVSMDILDSIHCYFIHSIDNGIRRIDIDEDEDTKNNEDENNVYLDKEIKALRSRLSLQQNRMCDLRGMDRIKNNKFITFAQDTEGMYHTNDTMYMFIKR